jgi:hypothetical protein
MKRCVARTTLRGDLLVAPNVIVRTAEGLEVSLSGKASRLPLYLKTGKRCHQRRWLACSTRSGSPRSLLRE